MRAMAAILLTLLAAISTPAAAKTCRLEIDANDRLQYSKSELVVPVTCDRVELTLNHVGRLPVERMGHNWVLSRSAVFRDLAQDGKRAGLDNGYLPPGDARVLAATGLVGGGESTRAIFDRSLLEPGGDYTYFCSFPGHYGAMNGRLVVR